MAPPPSRRVPHTHKMQITLDPDHSKPLDMHLATTSCNVGRFGAGGRPLKSPADAIPRDLAGDVAAVARDGVRHAVVFLATSVASDPMRPRACAKEVPSGRDFAGRRQRPLKWGAGVVKRSSSVRYISWSSRKTLDGSVLRFGASPLDARTTEKHQTHGATDEHLEDHRSLRRKMPKPTPRKKLVHGELGTRPEGMCLTGGHSGSACGGLTSFSGAFISGGFSRRACLGCD